MRVGIIENIDFSAVFHRFFFISMHMVSEIDRTAISSVFLFDFCFFHFRFWFLTKSVRHRPVLVAAVATNSAGRFCVFVWLGLVFRSLFLFLFLFPRRTSGCRDVPGRGRLVHRWTQRIINRRHHNYWLTAGLQWTRDGVVISSLRLRVTLSLFQTLEFSLTRVDLYRYRFTRHLRVFRYLVELWGGKNALERLISSRKAVFLCRIQVLDPVELFIFRARIIFHVFVTSLRNEWFAGFHVGRGAA